ncbi:2-oxoglutarate-dependent dioxygenase 19-like [Andrographis paniculata]|uniref:2-oxoglutarate-dependent dioxygenase 19-like n=1 Tax=Andrographis paniculata TaxID=175694 RepID=UPI0021E74E9B|nr:2-oxoglutarate-dependent dioxygenase 19-like [Andrographis paniculata]
MATAIASVKRLSESPNLSSIPSSYIHEFDPTDIAAADPDLSIPTVDLSLLASDDPDQKSNAVQELDRACQEWGFFMVINHGVPEPLIKAMIDAADEFFNLPEEEKPEFEPENVLTPIRYGTSFNTAKEDVFCWRDFVKIFVHPEFHCPEKPESLRDILPEYSVRIRDVVKKLLSGISVALGLKHGEMDKALGLESCLQIFVANLYPPCPNPDMALGLTPHSDHGLLTLLVQNDVGGLQIQHKGKWIDVNPHPNSILVNTCDQLEVFSNGRYKSVLHRAVVNNKKTRISIAVANGPSMEAEVSPAITMTTPGYAAMKYKNYLSAQQGNRLNGKSMLQELVRIRDC